MIAASPDAYLHDLDKKNLQDLKKLPGFDKLCSKFISIFDEPVMKVMDMAGKVHLSEQQLPRVYNMLPDICEKLGIAVPDLYLELNRNPNAYTYGYKSPAITVTSGLLESMRDEEIYAVLAHECGHIVCQHVLYHTMGRWILNGGILGMDLSGGGLLGSLITTPLRLAFFRWMRASEFSADRAAVICCGGANPVVQTMMRLAGGATFLDGEISRELFIHQADQYREMIDTDKWSKMLELYMTAFDSHPLLSVRAREALIWSEGQQFGNILCIMAGQVPEEILNPTVTAEELHFCRKCGGVVKDADAFCPACGEKQNKKSLFGLIRKN